MRSGSRSRVASNPDLPLSRPVAVDDVPDGGLEVDIVATEAERAAVAMDAGLPSIGRLRAEVRVERRNGGRYAVSGRLDARITQTCVVSLEPFESDVAQDIDLTFASVPVPVAETARPERRRRRDVVPRPSRTPPPPPVPIGEEDPPDPIEDGLIDLGAVAVEFLMLARDLYPRKPGVAFSDVTTNDDETSEPSAFAALQSLKDSS